MSVHGRAAPVLPPGGHEALGGGGLAHRLVRLVIWHELWRLARVTWRIPTFGPVIVVLVVLAVIGLAVLGRRSARRHRRNQGGSLGTGSGPGPRDW
jgi:hypothetical protein